MKNFEVLIYNGNVQFYNLKLIRVLTKKLFQFFS